MPPFLVIVYKTLGRHGLDQPLAILLCHLAEISVRGLAQPIETIIVGAEVEQSSRTILRKPVPTNAIGGFVRSRRWIKLQSIKTNINRRPPTMSRVSCDITFGKEFRLVCAREIMGFLCGLSGQRPLYEIVRCALWPITIKQNEAIPLRK